MKKYVVLCGTLAALVWAGVAAAALPQLSGTATFSNGDTLTIDAANPIVDGGTSYVGLENDRSGNCSGDPAVTMTFKGTSVNNGACAHYVASSRDGSGPKMRFSFFYIDRFYRFRISDGGATDTVKFNTTANGWENLAWINMGAIGSSYPAAWTSVTVTSGGFTITS